MSLISCSALPPSGSNFISTKCFARTAEDSHCSYFYKTSLSRDVSCVDFTGRETGDKGFKCLLSRKEVPDNHIFQYWKEEKGEKLCKAFAVFLRVFLTVQGIVTGRKLCAFVECDRPSCICIALDVLYVFRFLTHEKIHIVIDEFSHESFDSDCKVNVFWVIGNYHALVQHGCREPVRAPTVPGSGCLSCSCLPELPVLVPDVATITTRGRMLYPHF